MDGIPIKQSMQLMLYYGSLFALHVCPLDHHFLRFGRWCYCINCARTFGLGGSVNFIFSKLYLCLYYLSSIFDNNPILSFNSRLTFCFKFSFFIYI